MSTLDNVFERSDLRSLASKIRDKNLRISVRRSAVEEMLAAGWGVDRELKSVVKLVRPKNESQLLQDRLWSVMYLMGFSQMSGAAGADLLDAEGRTTDQLDLLARDSEVTVYAECKYVGSSNTRLNYSEILGRLHGLRAPLSRALGSNSSPKTKLAPFLLVRGARVHDLAFQRSAELGVPIITETDLEYYEELVGHIGPAARFQFLADLLPGKDVEGLKLRLPAVRGRQGEYTCYTFSIHPADLLKIAYVSHRMKGQGSDVNAYQRMIKKSRLNSIRQYIEAGGTFPTNIVLNVVHAPRFDQVSQGEGVESEARVGWLHLEPKYKSAWVIDGQHRLFAYSGSDLAERDYLTVMAIVGLDAATQAKLFVDINGEQRKVKQSLLQDLFAELHWNSVDPKTRTKAVISKVVQSLDRDDPDSPFYNRIQSSEGAGGSPTKCITINALFTSLESSRLFFETRASSRNVSFGPFWFQSNNLRMVKRVRGVLDCWFGKIRGACPEWWEAGKGDGGGLSMNDSISANIDVLRRVFEHVGRRGETDLLSASDIELQTRIEPFAEAAAEYLASFNSDERAMYRALRGIQGQSTRSKMIQVGVREKIPEFDPGDLDEFVESRNKETVARANTLLQEFEVAIKSVALRILGDELGNEFWWMEGVLEKVRLRAATAREGDKGANGGPENYLYLVDFREIAEKNWKEFEPVFKFEGNSSKETRTKWMVKLNDWRNVAAHPSKGKVISVEELAEIERYGTLFKSRIAELWGLEEAATYLEALN